MEPDALSDADSDAESLNVDSYRPVRLHATTSRFDDWLHRGPLLQPLPFWVYMQQVMRQLKPHRYQAFNLATPFMSSTDTTHSPRSTFNSSDHKSLCLGSLGHRVRNTKRITEKASPSGTQLCSDWRAVPVMESAARSPCSETC